MKKYLSLLIILMLFGFMFIPSVLADNKVGLKSIELVEKSENTTINSEPKFNNLEMNFDVAFKAKDDYVKYKVVVSNNTNIDYKISEDTSFNDSPYMTYKYDVEKDLKANDETIVYVTITYSKTIDSSKLANGKYSESNQAIVQLLDRNGNTVNPNTSSSIAMILINLFIVLFVSILLFIKFRGNKAIPLVLILSLFLIPITTYAVETLKLTINVNVEIENRYRISYVMYSGVYLTDEELKDWDVSRAEDHDVYIINDGSNTKKYSYYFGELLYKGNEWHYAGENVDLGILKFRVLYTSEYNSSTGKSDHYCSYDSDTNIYTCDSRVEEYYVEGDGFWYYSKSFSNAYNYPFFDTDKDVMNFSECNDSDWDDYLGLCFYAPVSFTMPAHDVLFGNISH